MSARGRGAGGGRAGNQLALAAGASLLILSATGLPAQTEFERRFAAAQAAEPPGRTAAFAAAYHEFTRLPVDGPAHQAALADGAVAALYGGLAGRAADLLAALWTRDGGSDRLLTLRLTALFRAGRGGAAADLARQHLDTFETGVVQWLVDPDAFGAIAAFAGALLTEGDDRGFWLLERQAAAMAGRPGREYALANLALAHRQLGNGDASREQYRAALRVAPRAAWLWNDYGLLEKGLLRWDDALAGFLSALKVEQEPGESAAGTNLGVLFQRTATRRPRPAAADRDPVPDLQHVLQQRPDSAMARRLLLDVLAGRGGSGGPDRRR